MTSYNDLDDFGIPPKVLVNIIEEFEKLNYKGRENVLRVLMSLSNIELRGAVNTSRPQGQVSQIASNHTIIEAVGSFSEDRSISPKDFILEKQHQTDVERVTCLAYYLTHYRDTPNFKPVDISTLNTEAAQPKLSNARQAVRNAVVSGYLALAANDTKQISALGGQFVQALPDREAAKASMTNARPKRKTRKATQKRADQS